VPIIMKNCLNLLPPKYCRSFLLHMLYNSIVHTVEILVSDDDDDDDYYYYY